MTHEIEAKGQSCRAASRNDATSMLRSSASRLMGIARAGATPAKLGASPSGKAADFDSAIRRFESSRPSQAFPGFQTFGRARGDAGNSGVFAAGRARSRTRMRCIRGYLRLFCLPVWGRDFQMSGIPRAGAPRPVRFVIRRVRCQWEWRGPMASSVRPMHGGRNAGGSVRRGFEAWMRPISRARASVPAGTSSAAGPERGWKRSCHPAPLHRRWP